MDYQFLIVEKKDGVAVVTFNNPKQLNAMSDGMTADLAAVVKEMNEDDEIRVVIFTGSGKAFIAGADVSRMQNETPEGARQYALSIARVQADMLSSRKIFIAAINGFTFGGGCEFALTCDLRVCSTKAMIGFPEVSLGILPGAGGTQRLGRLIGIEKAKEMILTADSVTGQQAYELGFVCKVCEPEALMDEAMALAKRIMKNSPLAVAYAKECISKIDEVSLTEGLIFERSMMSMLFANPDQHEGMTAFLEKRAKNFMKTF